MLHRQNRIEPASAIEAIAYDNPRAVVRFDKHEDVVHRVQRLQVKNGRLQILSAFAPQLLSAQ